MSSYQFKRRAFLASIGAAAGLKSWLTSAEAAAQGVTPKRYMRIHRGVGTIYRNYPQRSDLIIAVFRRELDATAAEAERLAAIVRREQQEAAARDAEARRKRVRDLKETAGAAVEAGGVALLVVGGVALVIGLAREDNHAELWRSGADLVVGDLAEITLAQINAAIRAKRGRG